MSDNTTSGRDPVGEAAHTNPVGPDPRQRPAWLQRTHRTEHETYQFLRLAMIGALGTLFFSLGIEYWQSDLCAQTSISAYYFTEVQAVFVGSLLVLGVSMVVIRGTLVAEDIALNLAGLLAPIVAFAPTTEFNYCEKPGEEGSAAADEEAGSAAVAAEKVIETAYSDGSVVNNMWAYLLVTTLALAAGAYVLWRNRGNRLHLRRDLVVRGPHPGGGWLPVHEADGLVRAEWAPVLGHRHARVHLYRGVRQCRRQGLQKQRRQEDRRGRTVARSIVDRP